MLFVLILALLYHPAMSDIDANAYQTYGGEAHPCYRSCQNESMSMDCEYDFTLEWYYVLTKACYDCPFNTTDCYRPHCVTTDGVRRSVLTVNRMLPGPSIEVCQNDTIIVNVKNKMEVSEGNSIHWHGLHQRGSQHMDGVAMVTQCPITSHSTFQYKFKAHPPGTMFWHAHSGLQRADGVFGNLVIRQALDPHEQLYDYDLSEHVIMVNDWLHELTVNKFAAHHHSDGDNKPKSMLINGKGVFQNYSAGNKTINTPRAVFNVRKGYRYRFRVASNGILNCPINMFIDGHTLLMISTDGTPFQPVEVDSFNIFAGERFDFVLDASNDVSNYWMYAKGLADCDVRKAFQTAILRYEGSGEVDPVGHPTYDAIRQGRTLNPWNEKESEMNIPVSKLEDLEQDAILSRTPDYQFYVAMDFNKIDNYHFHHPDYYPIHAMDSRHLYTPQMNDISMMFPPSPPLTQLSDIPEKLFCNDTTMPNCSNSHCECIHMLSVPLGAIVEVVLVDLGVTFDANHPIHLHGHSFRVVYIEKVNKSVTVEQVKELDKQGYIERHLNNSVKKDTVTVPDGGFTIIRFQADNAGYWFMHCHIEFHVEIGMGLIIKIGNENQMPPVPLNFPTCGNWKYETQQKSHSTSTPSELFDDPFERICSNSAANVYELTIKPFWYLFAICFARWYF